MFPPAFPSATARRPSDRPPRVLALLAFMLALNAVAFLVSVTFKYAWIFPFQLGIFLSSVVLLVAGSLSRSDALGGPSLFERRNGARVARWRSVTRLVLGVFLAHAVVFVVFLALGRSFELFLQGGIFVATLSTVGLRLWFDWRSQILT
jgi:hypothetical protein